MGSSLPLNEGLFVIHFVLNCLKPMGCTFCNNRLYLCLIIDVRLLFFKKSDPNAIYIKSFILSVPILDITWVNSFIIVCILWIQFSMSPAIFNVPAISLDLSNKLFNNNVC